MKKRILAILVLSAMVLGGCSSKAETSENQLEDFDIVLDWYPNAVHGFIYEAIDKGYYEEEGLNVNIQFPSNTNDALSLTAAGKVDAGIYYLHNMVEARLTQDVPIKSVGTICQDPLSVFLSLADAGIEGPEDLIGKTVGGSGSNLGSAMIDYVVTQAGGTPEDIEFIDVGFELMSSMTTGNVDVTWGGLVNHEVPQLIEEGFDVNYFMATESGLPNYYELILVAGDKTIEEDSEKLAKFLRASKKGFDEMKAHPEETVDLIIKNQNEENFPLSKSVEMQSIEILLPTMEKENSPFLNQEESVWEENMQWMVEVGLLEEAVDASEVMVNIEY